MILNLTVERQGLPPARIRWSTDSFTATHSAAAGSDPTIAQLVEQVNDVIPIENEIWGFEDYAVEVNGFECLHFARASKVLKDGDHLTIRPWQTQEVRFRSVSGRQQISADGRHLIDGVSFGRPFLRRGMRPPIRIQPKRRARNQFEYDDEDEDEDEPAGYLMPGQANPSVEPEENVTGLGLLPPEPQLDRTFMTSNLQGRSISQGGQPLKRHLEPAFEDAREGKRIRSALQPALSRSGRVSSANSKSVRFRDRTLQSPSEATPSTIIAQFDSDSEDDDDDFDPGESSSPEPEAGSDENKENFDPDTRQYSDPHPSSQPLASDKESDLPVHHTLSELPTARRSSVESSSLSGSGPSSSIESSDKESSDVSDSDDTSSDDDSSSSGSGSSESVTNEPVQPQARPQVAQASASSTSHSVPPGGGKTATKLRNRRRREQSKLNQLKALGELGADATLDGMREWQARNTKKDEFETSRQALLDALSTGGIDVTDGAEAVIPGVQTQPAVMDALPEQTSRSAPQPTHQPAAPNEEQEQSEGPKDKRRKIDLGASKRMLLGGLGLRVPKNKAEEDKMREKSRQKAQKEAERHQRKSEAEPVAAAEQPIVEDNWQEHVVLKSVECADPSINYSTPPFPFEQRWDPQQHYNNWRPKGHKKQKNSKRKRDESEIEEHYDATMYDDQPQGDEQDQAEEMAIDTEQNDLRKDVPTPLDVSDKVDLLIEQALVGARIAFRQLEMSEATGWQPKISDHKSAIVTSNDDDLLLLSLDGEYRVQKQIDPETGEVVGSRFIIADAQDDDDDGIVEIAFADLIEPKLLLAALTPDGSQAKLIAEQIQEFSVNAIDAIANSSKMQPGNGDIGMDTHIQDVDEGEETAVETSFNASTRTAVEPNIEQQKHKTASLDIDPTARDEASMLIREAGFRSAIDPEATKPLKKRKESTYPPLHPGNSQEDSPLFFPQDDETELENDESSSSFYQHGSAAPNISSEIASRKTASDYISLEITPRASSVANGHANQDVDYYSIQDSSQDMITEVLPAIVDESIGEAARTPSSVIHSPGPKIDLARQIVTGGDASVGIAGRETSPDAALIEAEDVQEVASKNDVHEDDYVDEELATWETLPTSRIPSQTSTQSITKQGDVRTTNTTMSGSRTTDRRPISMTQPEPSRNTRTTRRVSAMTNPIALSDDDDGDDYEDSDSNLPRMPPASTAPVTGFKAINRPPPSASQPAKTKTTKRRHTTDMVDLTQIASDDSSESDDSPGARMMSSFEMKAAAFRERQRGGRESENLTRTKSTI